MLLAIDIGNTNITLGVFDEKKISGRWSITTDQNRMGDEYFLIIKQLLETKNISLKQLKHISLCSVVPPLTQKFVNFLKLHFDIVPLVVGSCTKTGVQINYDNPRDVGTDRIVDAAAALNLYGGPIIVVDVGTAIVFDAITSKGVYLGGAIAPGMRVAADALFRNTAQLRHVDLSIPPSAIGTNTILSMQSGVVLGYSDLVQGMITRFQNELETNAKVVATGGMSEILHSTVDVFDYVNLDLTLIGLRIITEMNNVRN